MNCVASHSKLTGARLLRTLLELMARMTRASAQDKRSNQNPRTNRLTQTLLYIRRMDEALFVLFKVSDSQKDE
jgi:hypothetical protein